MGWRVAERRLGKAGGEKQRTARQREWDRKYGEDRWAIGYEVDGEFVRQEDALESVYYQSYAANFAAHPADLSELIALAKTLRNPHAEATTGVDLQVPAIREYLRRHELQLAGAAVVDIGTYDGKASHPISVRLSPLTIACVADPGRTLEQWWQQRKVLVVWDD
ncbi:hypothetical protein [Nannocystis bainbridge]|uniref:Uncharacterized protein n=1 Tax=Nannocystis bainbridge TaxID=2995303 RepID=A0ABT5E7G8_9BACT|nr:hypothetical protein [Nannocystis bainbridge]MDC0721811.1 hypothetical protein [Nannocystis bainbridge]